VGELVKTCLDHYPINHRANSVAFATKRLAHVPGGHLGNVLLSDLTEDRVRDYVKVRLAEGSGGRTINMEVGELSRAIGRKWSALWPKVRKLEENHDAGQALSPEQESRLLAAAAGDSSPNRNPVLHPFLCIALSTGMRSGEIASLVEHQLGRRYAHGGTRQNEGRHKAADSHQPDLIAVIEQHALWYRRKLGDIRPQWFMFPGRDGKPTDGHQRALDPARPIGDITTAWDGLRERSGVHCRLHDLHHTAATKMAEAGFIARHHARRCVRPRRRVPKADC
jgi:integrase